MFSTKWCQIERYHDSLQNEGSTTWNGEVVGKKRIMNYSQKLWPGTANWLVYYSMCQNKAHFLPQRSIKQKCASVSWNLAVTSWNVLSQGIGAHILFPSWSSFWVLKNKFLWFSHSIGRQDHISNHRGRHLLPKNWGLILKAYSLISYRGRSQKFQNLNFLHLFVAFLQKIHFPKGI